MCLLVALPKPVHGNVGVYLGSGEATVTKNFLHGAKIRPTIQQMGRGTMPQGVGPRCSRVAKCLQQDGYNRTDLAWVNAVSSHAQEQSRPARGSYQRRASTAKPVVDGKGSWNSERNGTLLVSLANDAEGPSIRIRVIDVQPGKLPNPHAGCVQQLHHRSIPDGQRTSIRRGSVKAIHDPENLLLLQDSRQRFHAFRSLQPNGWIRGDEFLPQSPLRERPRRGSAAGEGGPGHAGFALCAQPPAQRTQFQFIEIAYSLLDRESEKAVHICQIGPDSMCRPRAFTA
ncbi:hypothetical protein StoSoilB13_11530 [Arthrobacter sp. StoSoilB13]|nr:hypothetical protein StoSoilB13_11530 [Arthrobacter sp. StoSoilB13]